MNLENHASNAALHAIDWLAEMGEDVWLNAQPVAWAEHQSFVTPHHAPPIIEIAAKEAKILSTSPNVPITPSVLSESIQTARDLAHSAQNLEELHAIIVAYDGCSLKRGATNCVFSDGKPTAKIMVIGEVPSTQDDANGVPFTGQVGHILAQMLRPIGLDRNTNVYLTNVIPWRISGNRLPSAQEIALCSPFVLRHIELLNPDFIVLLGNISVQTICNTQAGIMRTRGNWFEHSCNGRIIPALATFHPAFLLKQSAQKRLAWRDMLALGARMKVNS